MTRPTVTTVRQESVSPTVPAPVTRPVPRRVQRSWLGFGIALIVVGALGAFVLWTKYGPANEYLAVAKPVPVGAVVTAGDLTVVRINSAPGLTPMTRAQMGQAVGKTAAVDLVAGSLLTRAHLTDRLVPGPGEQVLGLALAKDQMPGQRLKPGNKLVLVATSNQNPLVVDPKATQAPAPRTYTATVHRVSEPDSRGNFVIDVVVAERDGPTIAGLAADNRIVVILAPR